jgi:hypothetical protein
MFVKLTVGSESVLSFKPKAGDQEYMFPLTEEAPIIPSSPEQTLMFAPVLAVGKGFTVTVTESEETQPVAVLVVVNA